MPKKLNVSANQRVDIPDFNRAASGFTADSDAFTRRKLFLAKMGAVLEGFVLELADQSTSPGQVTLFNGNAIDRSGLHLNNEDQVNDSRTLTLVGAGTTFYIEIEFTESATDVDSRAFWDPTYVNPGAVPPGREFSLNVATRLAPDWQIVTPVSTTGFDRDTDPDSLKIPIAALSTDGSNEITVAVNPSLVLITGARNKLEYDVGIGDTTVRLVDSRIFPDTGTCTVDLGGASPESVSITANDRANGILTISPALAADHQAGAVVAQTGSTTTYLEDRVTATPVAADPDQRSKLFMSNEIRGSGLIESFTTSDRSDTDLRNVKDYVDSVSAIIREMKYGSPRSDEAGSGLPPAPADWATKRWYDNAGHLPGARTYSVTIGDSVDSLGDLNVGIGGVTDLGAHLQTAHDSLDATLGGSIYVKPGTYTISTSLTVDRPLELVFAEGAALTEAVSTLIDVSTTGRVRIHGMRVTAGPNEKRILTSATTGLDLTLVACEFGSLDTTSVTSASSLRLRMEDCSLTATGNDDCLTFYNQVQTFAGTVSATSRHINLIAGCTFEQTVSTQGHVVGAISFLNFQNCDFVDGQFFFNITDAGFSWDIEQVNIDYCRFSSTDLNRGLLFDANEFTELSIRACDFNNCDVSALTGNQALIEFDTAAGEGVAQVVDCVFVDTTFTGATSAANTVSYIRGSFLNSLLVHGNRFGSTADDDYSSEFRDILTVVTASLVTFSNNVCRYYRRALNVSSSQTSVFANNFSVTAASSDEVRTDVRVFEGAGDLLVFDSNFIYHEYLAISGSFRCLDFDSAVDHAIISNNVFQRLTAEDGSVLTAIWSDNSTTITALNNRFVDNYTTDSLLQPVDVSSGATIRFLNNVVLSEGTDAGTDVLILCDTGSVDNVVDGNYIQYEQQSADPYTIVRLQGACKFSNNRVVHGSALATVSEVVVVGTTDCSVENNEFIGTYGNENRVVLITGTGDLSTTIRGNRFIGSSTADGPFVLMDTTVASIVTISENYFEFNGNTDSDHDGVIVDVETGYLITVSDNRFAELGTVDEFAVGRYSIFLRATTTTLHMLEVCNNVIHSTIVASGATSRTSNMIRITDSIRCMVNNNLIDTGDSDIDTDAIYLDTVNFFVCSDNVVFPPNASGPAITFDTCQSGIYDGNLIGGLGTAGTFDTTGSTGLVAGDNKVTTA